VNGNMIRLDGIRSAPAGQETEEGL